MLAGGNPPLGHGPPAWAYSVNPPSFMESPDDGSSLQVPDSDARFTLAQIREAPKTRVVDWRLAVASPLGMEALGQRIIEVPENLEQFERRNGRARGVAYVPPGSVQRGQKLVTTGGGKTVSCTICHGPDLKGVGPIPGIAGRSPSYVIRQLYDFRAGARAGAGSALMRGVVEKLSMDDMISLAAYVASLNP